MKLKITTLVLAALVALSVTGCSGNQDASQPQGDNSSSSVSSSSAPAEPLTGSQMAEAITAARSQEENDVLPIYTEETGEEDSAMLNMVLEGWGLEKADLQSYAMSVSLINVRAYGVAVLQPAEGRAQAVTDGVNQFVTSQQNAFENYLPDQKEIANSAIVDTRPDGTIILVMCEDAQTVYDSILAGLESK